MPTTDDIRLAWAVYHDRRETREDRRNTTLWETLRDAAYADFDRWLAERDVEVKSAALTEFIETYRHSGVLWLPDLVQLLEFTAKSLRHAGSQSQDSGGRVDV